MEKSIFTDSRDGKEYKCVKIGSQIWMAENLNYEAEGSRCYNNDPANGQKYGRLYDWNTAKKACPEGWHLPSKEEWDTLIAVVGGIKSAGKHLKAKFDWNEKNGNGEDTYGFSALPGSISHLNSCHFGALGHHGQWWSASELEGNSYYPYSLLMYGGRADCEDNATCRKLGCTKYCWKNAVHWSCYDKPSMFSVRCLKDEYKGTQSKEEQ